MKISSLITYFLRKLFFPIIKKTKISSYAKICNNAYLYNVTVDKYSYIGSNSIVNYAKIGKYCSISDNVNIGRGTHSTITISTSPVFFANKNLLNKNYTRKKYNPYKLTIIKNDVWIGSNVFIKSGLIVGNGAIIGSGSIVTKNVPDYQIWAGNPAKFIKNKFNKKKISKLLKIKWWDWEEDKIKKYSNLFNNPKEFFDKFL